MNCLRSLQYRKVIDFTYTGNGAENIQYTIKRGTKFSSDQITTRVDKLMLAPLARNDSATLATILSTCSQLSQGDLSALTSYFNRDLRDKRVISFWGFKTTKGKKYLIEIDAKMDSFATRLNAGNIKQLQLELDNLGEFQLAFHRQLLTANLLKKRPMALLLCRHQIYKFLKLQRQLKAKYYEPYDNDYYGLYDLYDYDDWD
ncbi:MAG: hypothetical protein JKY54_15140 [Flavobacteriales bacterium]|nr:hypothetical protein [Flavobacteriales bacterium]